MNSMNERIAVVGLGYVGLPVAVELAAHYDVVGFDVSAARIAALREGRDATGEVSSDRLVQSRLCVTDVASDMAGCSFFIVTVPTPIDATNEPDLGPVVSACKSVGPHLSPGSVVVFESTVYPGVTDDICGPLLEEHSGLRRGSDFRLGYSPERINPGDKEHRLENIVKIISADDGETLARLRSVYGSVVRAGLHEASSIKVAEAAKVIENTQRDLNIALMNELALILDRMNIRTRDVLAAAGTKWNFLRFSPGLVGGHCIGVDPYYLTHASRKIGYNPEVILAGRRVNNAMSGFIARKTLSLIGDRDKAPRVGVLGLTFKENVPDLRNSKVPDLIAELEAGGAEVLVHDSRADPHEAQEEYGIALVAEEALSELDAIVLAVGHSDYQPWIDTLADRLVAGGALVDVRSFVDPARLSDHVRYWSL